MLKLRGTTTPERSTCLRQMEKEGSEACLQRIAAGQLEDSVIVRIGGNIGAQLECTEIQRRVQEGIRRAATDSIDRYTQVSDPSRVRKHIVELVSQRSYDHRKTGRNM